MAIIQAQKDWMKNNTISVNLRINRNQEPELFELLRSDPGASQPGTSQKEK